MVQGDGFNLRLPEWIQGMRSYGWNGSSTALYYFRYSHGETTLWKVNLPKGESEKLDIRPVQWAVQMSMSPVGDDLVFLGSSPKMPKQICLYKNGKLTFTQSNEEKEAGAYCTEPDEIYIPDFRRQNWDMVFITHLWIINPRKMTSPL